MAAQYAFVMKDMTKSFPGAQKPVLNHINLQFYHGAKIGIVGPNGAGKSTLMKIMAGIDKEFSGRGLAGREHHRRLSASRSRSSTRPRPCWKTSRTARARSPTWSIASTPSRPRWAIPGRHRLRRADGGDGRAPGARSTRSTAGRSTTSSKSRWRRCAARRATSPVDNLSGGEKRRVALTRLLIQKPVDPAARRADQPSRRRKRPVARKPPQGICRRGADDHPRPLFPRQCRQLDPRARSRKILPLRGQLLDLPREEGQAARAGGARGERPPDGDPRRARMDPAGRQGPPDQVEGAYRQVRPARRGAGEARPRQGRDPHPGARAARRQGHRGQGPDQGLWRQTAVRGSVLHAAAGRHRRRDRPQRRRQVDAVQADHRPGEARLRRDRHRSDGSPRLCRPEPRPSRWHRRTSGRRFPTGSTT